MTHLRDAQTSENQKCIVVLYMHHQISEDYQECKNFFQDSIADSK